MAKDIHVEVIDEELLELFEDITLEEVVSNKACVGKVIGWKDMPASVVKKILTGVWQRLEPWRMKKCDEGVLEFFFEDEDDCSYVLENRPWLVNGVVLNLKPLHVDSTRCVSNENAPTIAKKVGPFIKADSKSKDELDKVCQALTAMMFPATSNAIQMYGIWIKSETGWSNCFNHARKGRTMLLTDNEGAGQSTALGKPGSNVAKKMLTTTATMSYPTDNRGTIDTCRRRNFEKYGNVGNAGSTENEVAIENVINMEITVPNFSIGSEVLDFPGPDFASFDANNELIPDIGPLIAQSLEIPHNWVCLSQKPHMFPEPTPIGWPNHDPEAQQIFLKLYGPDYLNLYKAQQSLLSNPPNLSEMIIHLLDNNKKCKAHTWLQPYPSSPSQNFTPNAAVVTEIGSTSEAPSDVQKFVIGAGDKDVELSRRA
uniref:DUF4283 domain-containing protein n=1 Tax=Cannabis sativa TaxID=3483 RepID=A0A803PRU7_CANSA